MITVVDNNLKGNFIVNGALPLIKKKKKENNKTRKKAAGVFHYF